MDEPRGKVAGDPGADLFGKQDTLAQVAVLYVKDVNILQIRYVVQATAIIEPVSVVIATEGTRSGHEKIGHSGNAYLIGLSIHEADVNGVKRDSPPNRRTNIA